MAKRICTQCGGEVVASTCLRPKCQVYWQNYWERVVKEKIIDYQSQINSLLIPESSLEYKDYSDIKKIEREIKNWETKLENSSYNSELKQLSQKLTELEKKFPARIRLKYQNKGKLCFHKNIAWNGCFNKQGKNDEPYCLDCGEDGNKEFTRKFQMWYGEKVEKWLREKKLNIFSFQTFLKKKDYLDNWLNLRYGNYFSELKSVVGEFGVIDEFELVNFREMSNYIEEYCLEFAGEQKSNIPNKDDIEREKLKRTIKKLERKPNKSPEEETELKNLKGKLKDLEKNNNSSPFNYTPWLIGGGFLLVFLVIIVIIFSKRQNK